MKTTLFERVGGFARVRLMVSEFYRKILESDRLSVYFENADMRRLIDHQTKFISAVLGGPASYTNEQITRAHARLGITSEEYDEVADLMLDFVDFTDMAISRDPSALIAELNDVFTSFDRIIEHFRCERIKTIGDGYMAVAGLPEPDPDHVRHLARAALRMRRFLERRNRSAAQRWRCRIGLGCGPVIGSIVGIQKFVYDIFGPAVNMAARLEALCDPMQILVCPQVCEAIRDEFVVQSIGEVHIKGFGIQEVFALVDEARPKA